MYHFKEIMKNKSATRKGPGIIHANGYKKPGKKRKEISFTIFKFKSS